MSWSSTGNERASVLVEVLVSVVIVSVTLTAVMQSFMASLKATVSNQEYTQALALLENRLAYLIRNHHADSPMGSKNFHTTPSEKYKYHDSLEPMAGDSQSLEILKLGVSWGAGGKNKDVSLTTFLLKPADENH